MIFQTQNQLNCFFFFLFFGIIIGLISLFYFTFFIENFQKKLLKCIISTIFYSLFYILFVILINFFNFGNFSIALFAAYVGGYNLIVFNLKNLVVILETKWYNKIRNLSNRFKQTNTKRIKKSNDNSKKS